MWLFLLAGFVRDVAFWDDVSRQLPWTDAFHVVTTNNTGLSPPAVRVQLAKGDTLAWVECVRPYRVHEWRCDAL